MTSDKRPTCGDCRFFQVNPCDIGNGECHVELKTAFVPTNAGPTLAAGWPTTGRDSLGCGKFEAREGGVNGDARTNAVGLIRG